jgi:hypothetical protein
LRLQKIKARRPQKMPFNSLAETLTYIKVVDGLGAKAIATAGFAGLTVSELQGLDWKDRYDGQWHVERKVVEGRTGDTKTAARQEGVPIIPYLEKITDKYWKNLGCPRRRTGLWQMDEQPEARPYCTSAKEKRDEVEWLACFSPWPGVAWSRTCMRWEFLLKLYRESAVTPTKQRRRSTTSTPPNRACGAACESWKRRLIREKPERR